MLALAEAAYGKRQVRLVKVQRHGDRHDVFDATVGIRFEGGYDASYLHGDNSDVLPTDTMKNAIYALAAQTALSEPEAFALLLARHFLGGNPEARCVVAEITQHPWSRIPIGAGSHPHAFLQGAGELWTAVVRARRDGVDLWAGIEQLSLLKTARSAFAGFRRDVHTTLADTADRLVATTMTARWQYGSAEVAFTPSRRNIRRVILETFSQHDSQSVQHTLYAIGESVLASHQEVDRIHLVMPNRHHWPVDVSVFGLDDQHEVFMVTEEPYGLIEATVERTAGPEDGV
jgi:urate oxidase